MTEQSRVEIEHCKSVADFKSVWPVFRRQYLAMLKRGAGESLTEDEIIDCLYSGEYQMIYGVLENSRLCGSCIFTFQEREKGLACFVVGIAGWDMDEWKDPFCDYMDEVCKMKGCYALETIARAGNVPQLKERGWRTKGTWMEKRYGQ